MLTEQPYSMCPVLGASWAFARAPKPAFVELPPQLLASLGRRFVHGASPRAASPRGAMAPRALTGDDGGGMPPKARNR